MALLAEAADAASGLASASYLFVYFESLGLHADRSELLAPLGERFLPSFLAPSFMARSPNSLFAPSYDLGAIGLLLDPSKALTCSVSITEEAGLCGDPVPSSSARR